MGPLKNQRHEQFALGVVQAMSDTVAYREAYGCSHIVANTRAGEVKRREDVSARIRELQVAVAEHVNWSIADRLKYLRDVALTPIGEIDETNPLCQSHEFFATPGSETRQRHRVKMPDKLKAVELYTKIAGDARMEAKLEETLDSALQVIEEIRARVS